jgi:hypothetical protein
MRDASLLGRRASLVSIEASEGADIMRAPWIAAGAAWIAAISSPPVAAGIEGLPHVVSITRVPSPGMPADAAATSRSQPLDSRFNGVVWHNGPASSPASRREPDPVLSSYRVCELTSRAENGKEVPEAGGATLQVDYATSSTINVSGRIAFAARLSGSARNQGVFVADSTGIQAIIIGCGGGGGSGQPGSGCGDPSPIGGTFSGVFPGTVYTPAINDAGDVLFLCDVDGGTSPRGLFLYRNATDTITKVAAVGDPSPAGGVFAAIGPGSMNNDGTVVFLAAPPSTDVTRADVFRWHNGVVTKIAAVGDPAPTGGTFTRIGDEAFGYIDGTHIPVGPVPDINNSDQICFNAREDGGTGAGVVVRTGTVSQWYLRAFDRVPGGGNYASIGAATINDRGEIAFYAPFYPPTGDASAGVFAGRPLGWWKVIAFGDPIDGGECHGLAWSRNPMQSIDEDGSVSFWTGLGTIDDPQGRVLVAWRDGTRLVVARYNDPTPVGGLYGRINPWPSMNKRRGTVNASTPGATTAGALMTYRLCTTVPVALQSFGSRWAQHGVEVYWQLAGIESELAFEVYRGELPGGADEGIDAVIRRSGSDFVFEDRTAGPGKTYGYRVVVLEDGESVASFDTEIATPRAAFVLHPNVPNPFNPTTRIDFVLDTDARAALTIYDVGGRPVRTLLQAALPPGPHSVTWDGRDDRGSAVASGIYMVQLTADGRTMRRKAVLSK